MIIFVRWASMATLGDIALGFVLTAAVGLVVVVRRAREIAEIRAVERDAKRLACARVVRSGA